MDRATIQIQDHLGQLAYQIPPEDLVWEEDAIVGKGKMKIFNSYKRRIRSGQERNLVGFYRSGYQVIKQSPRVY